MKFNIDKQDLGLWAIALMPFVLCGTMFAVTCYCGFYGGN